MRDIWTSPMRRPSKAGPIPSRAANSRSPLLPRLRSRKRSGLWSPKPSTSRSRPPQRRRPRTRGSRQRRRSWRPPRRRRKRRMPRFRRPSASPPPPPTGRSTAATTSPRPRPPPRARSGRRPMRKRNRSKARPTCRRRRPTPPRPRRRRRTPPRRPRRSSTWRPRLWPGRRPTACASTSRARRSGRRGTRGHLSPWPWSRTSAPPTGARPGAGSTRAARRPCSPPGTSAAASSARPRARWANGMSVTALPSAATRPTGACWRICSRPPWRRNRTSPSLWSARGPGRIALLRNVAMRSLVIGISMIARATHAIRTAAPPRASQPPVGLKDRSLEVSAMCAKSLRLASVPISNARRCSASWW
mmetsp:Transcript_4371/g.12170  ORF Transcript_4371/g.12170 Transcript_4371/m.12170 type:complete len:360 (-) Transcript_4371:1719-2798(-)